jgi:alpha-beta hydrolase superfamily lysophospholipase
MGQSTDTFDQSSIVALRKNLPPFCAEMPLVSQSNTQLLQYLNYYQLPIPPRQLKLRAGTINVQQQPVVTMSWTPQNARGSVIVVHGYMDHTGLFNHLIEHLLNCQLNVICFDMPGHGLSAGQPGFVLDYADYVSALNCVISASQAMFEGPLQAIGQSMGGAILLKHLMQQDAETHYPFDKLNLLAPLLEPRSWTIKRCLFLLTKHFLQSSKRVFRPSSFDQEFLDFVQHRDYFQPRTVPMAWVAALSNWIVEFKQFAGTDRPINLIQGSGDKTLNWQYNLEQFKSKLSGLEVQIIADANHHMVNEIEPLRREIFAALRL